MKKIGIFFTLVVLLAMIPLTYVVGRGGGRHGGRGGYNRYGNHSYRGRRYRGYRYGGYRGYNNAAWAIPLAIGTAAAIGSAAASSSNTDYDTTTYYPEYYDDNYENQDGIYTTLTPTEIRDSKAVNQITDTENNQTEETEEGIEISAGA